MRITAILALIAGLMAAPAVAQTIDFFPMVPGSGPMLSFGMPMVPGAGPMGSGGGSGGGPATAAPTITAVAPNVGALAGGTLVTVTGTQFIGLTGAAAVKFGANNATSYTVLSPTALTAVSPAGLAGTVDVRVTNPIGTSAIVVADQFTYSAGCTGLTADFSNPCSIAVFVATMGM